MDKKLSGCLRHIQTVFKELINSRQCFFIKFIGIVFQDFRLLKDRNVYENVAFAQRIIQKSNKEIKKNVPSILAVITFFLSHCNTMPFFQPISFISTQNFPYTSYTLRP